MKGKKQSPKRTRSSKVTPLRTVKPEVQRVRYAVVGLGHIAQSAVLPAFAHARANSELVALVSDSDQKLETLGKRYGVKSLYAYDQLEECFELDFIDAVYIALPNALHRSFVLRAIRAGVHVLCEKPLGISSKECHEMILAAREKKVSIMTAYRLHFDEANMETVRAIQEGKIGNPKIFSSVHSFQLAEDNIRTQRELGGGALFDIGIYCINAARYIFKDEPLSVFARILYGDDRRFDEVESTCSALMKFPNNRIAQFACSFAAADSSYFEVVGSKGRLRLESAFSFADPCTLSIHSGSKEHRKLFKRHDQFAAELLYFSGCIRHNLEPEPSGIEGLADIQIIDALRQSAREDREIEVAVIEDGLRPDAGQVITKPPVQRRLKLVDASPPHMRH